MTLGSIGASALNVDWLLTELASVGGRANTGHFAVADEDALTAVLADVEVSVVVDAAQIVPSCVRWRLGRRWRVEFASGSGEGGLARLKVKAFPRQLEPL